MGRAVAAEASEFADRARRLGWTDPAVVDDDLGRLTSELWDVEWIVGLIEARTPPPGPRGPYRMRRTRRIVEIARERAMKRVDFEREVCDEARAFEGPKDGVLDGLGFWIALSNRRPDRKHGCLCHTCRKDPWQRVKAILRRYGFSRNAAS